MIISRSKKRSEDNRPFDVKKDGYMLAKFLNLGASEPLVRPQMDQVEEILRQLQALTDDCSRRFAAAPARVITRKMSAAQEDWRRTLAQFNALLAPHTWHLELVGFRKVDGRALPVLVDLPTPGKEAGLLFRLIQLARAGKLDRVRNCISCGDWFFAPRNGSIACSKPCWQGYSRSSDEYRAAHARTVLKNYQLGASPHWKLYRRVYREQPAVSPNQATTIVRGLLRAQKRRTR